MQHWITRVQIVLCGLAMTLLLAGAHPALAQNPGPPSDGMEGPGGPPPGEMQQGRGPSVDRELKQLTRLLTLTDEQQAQVKTILTDQQQKIEALFSQARQEQSKSSSDAAAGNDGPPSAEAMQKTRSAMEAIRKDSNAKIAAVLNNDQKTKFAEWEKRHEMHGQQGDDTPPPPPDGEGGPPPDGGGPGGGGPPGA